MSLSATSGINDTQKELRITLSTVGSALAAIIIALVLLVLCIVTTIKRNKK